MKSLPVIAIISAFILVACGSKDEPSSEYLAEGKDLPATIESLPDIKGKSHAEPATVGIYNVKSECAGAQQVVSFRIRTQGAGALNVKAEEYKSVDATLLYARQVVVNDENRSQVELDLHSFRAPAAQDVFVQLSGGSGMAGSYEVVLPSVC